MYKFVFFVVFLEFICESYTQLFNGDDCTPSQGGGSGKCISLRECPSAIIGIQNGLYPDTCGFEENMPLVCCTSGSSLTESVSQKKCRQYATFIPQFEIFAIVGGQDTLPQEFPHMAAVGYTNGNNVEWQCGGSLISEEYVLTAAHCLVHATFGPASRVLLGDTLLSGSTGRSSPQDFTVSERIPQPSYRSPSTYNDIALLKLSRPAQFNNFVKPACLYTSPTILPTTELVATGWGLTDQGGSTSNKLQKVDLELYTEAECNKTYGNLVGTRKLKDGIKTQEQFCAGGRNSNKDTCQGDSGGPLQTYMQSERIWSIAGVTSFGKACGASIPGVYTRVSFYVQWIESVVWPNN